RSPTIRSPRRGRTAASNRRSTSSPPSARMAICCSSRSPPAKEPLIAQYGSDGRIDNHGAKQRVADAFFENFNDPRTLTPAFTDMHLARQIIAALSRGQWLWSGVRGRAAIARDQVRQRLRLG